MKLTNKDLNVGDLVKISDTYGYRKVAGQLGIVEGFGYYGRCKLLLVMGGTEQVFPLYLKLIEGEQ